MQAVPINIYILKIFSINKLNFLNVFIEFPKLDQFWQPCITRNKIIN